MLRRMLTCPLCAARVAVPATATAGKRAVCGACGELFRVPGRALGVAASAVADGLRTAPSSGPAPFGAFWQGSAGATARTAGVGTLRLGSRLAPGQPDGPGQGEDVDSGQREACTRLMLDLRALRAQFRRTAT